MKLEQFTAKLFGFFVRGLLLLAPLFLTVYIIHGFFNWLDSKFYFYFPGAGILTVLVAIIAVGWAGSTFITQPVIRVFEEGLSHLPLVRLIYFSIKDLISAFVGDEKKFDRPVLLHLNRQSDIYKVGFITQEELSDFGLSDFVSVYCPHSYAFSGELYIVPKTNVKILNISTADAMKFIVSGGVSKGIETE